MIKFISAEDVLPLRSSELRTGKATIADMRYPTDNADGVLHLGYFIKGKLVSALSIHPQHYGQYTGQGYQMRGAATLEAYRRQGIGTKLLNFAIVYLQGQRANYLWCNGDKRSLKFFQNAGFEVIASGLDVPSAGQHPVLYLKIS